MAEVLLVATIKDEGPHILEWVAHHRLIGFDRIMLFENDSTDLTNRTLGLLGRMGVVEFHKNSRPEGDYQNRAYRRAGRSAAYQECEWCMSLDGDEFLSVNVGNGTVHDLIAATPDADAILVSWRNFGSGGYVDISPEMVTRRFVTTNPVDEIRAEKPEGFKSVFRTDAFKRPGIHKAREPLRD
ncbi:MAG: glycosyltransferase family 2 protein, partial [Boseongicola sp.]